MGWLPACFRQRTKAQPITHVGAAAGCDHLILLLKGKVKGSQPSAAPTGGRIGKYVVIASKLCSYENQKRNTHAPHHSIGRVSARLLLILEPVGRLSGGIDPGWERSDRLAQPNTARGGAAKQTVGAAPRIDPGAKEPEPQRGPNVRAKRFGYFWASAKVTRRKGGTLTSHTRSNGSTPKN